jgi:hypothetical protein
MHFYAWKAGLKTGMYYLRTRQKADAIQFTVDQVALKEARDTTAIVGGSFAKPQQGFAFPSTASTAASAAAGTAPGGTPGPKLPIISASLDSSASPTDSESSRDASPVMFTTPIARRAVVGGGGGGGGGGGAGAAPAGASPAPEAPMTPEQRTAFLEAKAKAAAEARAKARAEFEAQQDAEKAGECLNCGS